jgi:3-oxoacyl-[acyl-carrier protein] reductase
MAIDIDLDGKRALVCGASSGLGQAVARRLVGAGAHVTALARREDKLSALVKELGGENACGLCSDMDDLVGFAEIIQHEIDQTGGFDIVVHNTGGPKSGPILEQTEEDMVAVFARHQLTAHFLVRAALPHMKEAGYGRFVQILSTSAREPIDNLGLSNAIRAGMVGWAKTVANELPAGITINNVLPGYTATDRLENLKSAVSERTGKSRAEVEQGWVDGIPEGRLGRPSEIADAVLFLASPMASYVRGLSLPVEGGRLKGI